MSVKSMSLIAFSANLRNGMLCAYEHNKVWYRLPHHIAMHRSWHLQVEGLCKVALNTLVQCMLDP